MEAKSPSQALWELFVTIHPILKQALPKNAHGANRDPTTTNIITKIRHGIRAIPLSLPDGDLELGKLDGSDFYKSLHSLLEVLETFVSDKVKKYADLSGCTDYDQKLSSKFSLLARMRTALITSGWSSELPITSLTRRPSAKIVKFAKYVDFEKVVQDSPYGLADLQQRVFAFKQVLNKLFRSPIEALEENMGNPIQLAYEEITFINLAEQLNDSSKELFNKLAESFSCAGAHQAKLHLSGFLASDAIFELLVTDCGDNHWNSIQCTWARTEHHRAEQAVCSRYQVENAPKHIRLAFNEKGLWEDEVRDHEEYALVFSNKDPTLHELILGNRHDTGPSNRGLNPQEKRIIELLVACSLMNLDTGSWIPVGLSIDEILIRATRDTPDLLGRWKPYVSCSLQPTNEEDDENAAMLSFGILLMEMEANQRAHATDNDRSWDGTGFSQDSVLRRILGEWTEYVEEDYRNVATACLLFRQLTERFYDPQLMQGSKRAGATYKYILAPLSRLVRQRFRKCIPFFTTIPTPTQTRLTENNRERFVTTNALILFDGSDALTPTQSHIDRAKKFMDELEKFAKRVENVTKASPIPRFPWLAGKIRIAILDTGIDLEDDFLIEEALDTGRIKKCRGFVDDQATADYHDTNGHGTHVTRLVLNAAPSAEILVAKISDHTTIDAQNLHRIAKAIDWAVGEKANIISMSFGLDVRDEEIDQSIHAAVAADVGIFAASANNGGNKPRSYPSKRSQGVVCIHASDGAGNDGGISPTPKKGHDNFTTLGIAIQSKWKGDPVYISGTSFSTPIAAALVADVLEFARHRCKPSKHQYNVLCSFGGISGILHLMVEQDTKSRQGYDYVMPLHLWPATRSDNEVSSLITGIFNS